MVTVAGFGPPTLALIAAVVAFGGVVKGTVGFGYAIASTAVLATLLDPGTAVVVMILPTMAANLSLLGELRGDALRDCLVRFGPFLATAVLGTLVGMALLDVVPTRPLAAGLGAGTVLYAALEQDRVALPGESWLRARCFRPGTLGKAGYGLFAGLVFGVSNVGVQVVAYLDALELDRSTFVGVLSMVLVGVSAVRVGAAAVLGLYGGGDLLAVSLAAAAPGVLGVAVGGRLRQRLPESTTELGVVVLLAVIGLRLLVRGLLGV